MDWSDGNAFQRWRRSSSAKLTAAGLVLFLVLLFFLLPGSGDGGAAAGGGGVGGGGGGGGGAGGAGGAGESIYSVVIDAGSSGSRVHVYEIRKEGGSFNVVDELFQQLKPGLSAYKDDPEAAARSLDPLLEAAAARVPKSQHAATAIGLGATAGLRMIGEAAAARILTAARQHVLANYDFQIRNDEDVRILDGNEEGKYAWIAVNTLLGQVGRDALDTYAACDLGGGSVQCMFALPSESASLRKGNTRSKPPPGYVETVTGGGRKYDLYVHSFLGYGLLAARMAVLKGPEAPAACLPSGFAGAYQYGDVSLPVAGQGTASFSGCRAAVKAALRQDEPCADAVPLPAEECPVAGQWAGNLGAVLRQAPQSKLHLMSFFYEKTKSVGAGSPGKELDEHEDESSLQKLKKHASLVCSLSEQQLKKDPTVHLSEEDDIPYLCLDAVYMYSFLVDGIGVSPDTRFAMEKKIQSGGKDFEAAWSLGMGMEIL